MNKKNTSPCRVHGLLTAFPQLPVNLLSLLAILAIPLDGQLLAADPPALIPFQGHLARPTATDPNKFEPVPSGQYDILFTLYAAPVGGESKVWGPERHTRVVVGNGVVNAMLGSVIGFSSAIAANPNFLGRPLYVGITIDADGNPNTADLELVPRQVFLPAVHALNATKLNGADWRTFFDGTDDRGTFTPGTTKAKNATIADRALNADRALIANTVNNGAIGTAQLADGSVTLPKIAGGAGLWTTSGADVYRSAGNVGIGTTTPRNLLDVAAGGVIGNSSVVVNQHDTSNRGIKVSFGHNISGTEFNGMRAVVNPGLAGCPGNGGNSGDVLFNTWECNTAGSREVMRINGSGNVGIGTTTPGAKLEVDGNVLIKFPGTTVQNVGLNINCNHPSGNWSITSKQDDGGLQFYNQSTAKQTMYFLPNGNVGIGTITPTVPLDVVGFANHDLGGGFWFTFVNESRQAAGGSHINSISIRANAGIQSSYGLFVTSDRRTKKDLRKSDPNSDLEILNQLQVTDYAFKDVVTYGDKHKKGFIAQEVEKVFPQAVNKSTDVVPDIYKPAPCKDGWVELATDLKKGERVRLIAEKADGIHEVLEVTKDKFRTDFKPEGDKLFVFGREVNDFRALDYDVISVLNVSATQELAKRIEKLETREAHVAELEQKAGRVATLEREVADLKKMVTQLAAASQGSKQVAAATPQNLPSAADASLQRVAATARLDR